jgi:hypothetical protein
MLIRALIGLEADAVKNHIFFDNSILPSWLDWLEIKNLKLGKSRMDLMAYRGQLGAAIELLTKEGDFHMTVTR